MSNICVVGGGYWGSNHLRTLNELGFLSGMVDTDSELRANTKKNYPEISIFSNIEEAIESDIFNGFVVASPVITHYEVAKKILERGISVLIEKPFCTNLIEAEELADLAIMNNSCLMVGHLLLFHPSTAIIKAHIDNGKLGNLKYVYSSRLNLGKIRSHEDVFWSFAPHDISLLQHFIGSDPIDISNQSHSFLENNIADMQITLISYPKGVKAHIYSSWLHPFKEHRLVLVGDKGLIDYHASHNNYLTYQEIEVEEYKNLDPVINVLNSEEIHFEPSQPLQEELKYFVKKINNNEKASIAGIDNALQTTRIMETASSKNVKR